jgi:iron-sulfur cluster insertion protein
MTDLAAEPAPLTVTASAARRIAALVAREGGGTRLRVGVSGGGCSGFQYTFGLDASEEEGDVLVTRDGASVVIDGVSLPFLAGAELDWVEDLTGSYFRMNNPNATAGCGCGSSFAI